MARSNTVSAGLGGTGRTAAVQNSHRQGHIKTHNSDTESNTKDNGKPEVKATINSTATT